MKIEGLVREVDKMNAEDDVIEKIADWLRNRNDSTIYDIEYSARDILANLILNGAWKVKK